jgi:hypothetical protein
MAFRLFRQWADRRLRRRCDSLIELCTAYIFLRIVNDLSRHDELPSPGRDWAVAATHHLLMTRPTTDEARDFYQAHQAEISVLAQKVLGRDEKVRPYAGLVHRIKGVLAGPPEGQRFLDRADELDPEGRVPTGKRMQAIISAKNFRWLAKQIEMERAKAEV